MSLLARLALFATCGVAGYLGASALISPDPSASQKQTNGNANGSLAPLTANVAESALVAEWEELRRAHGGDSADLNTLYTAVKETKDAFRRRAFRAALIAERAVRDPRAGIAYLLQKDAANAGQLMREWLRVDPDAAVTGILGAGPKAHSGLRGLQTEIARVAPDRLVEVANALGKSENRWDTSTEQAFAVLAEKDPAMARQAAESVNGPLRGQALGGVARKWAETDGPAALKWAEGLAVGESRDAALKGVLVGWAKTDPIAALDKIDLVPPGGDEMYYASDVGAQVLREAGRKDWDATVRWLLDHPGKLGRTSLDGLQSALSQRLAADPGGTMRSLAKSGLPALENVFANAVLNDAYAQRDAIWHWLDQQSPSDFTRSMRGSLLNAIAWKEPGAAVEFIEKLPDSAEDRPLMERAAMSLLNGGSQLHLLDDLLGKASSRLRPHLLQSALQYANESIAADPQLWIQRLNELPAERQLNSVQGFARGWASGDPLAASNWALALPDATMREGAVGSAAGAWAQADPHQAAEWIDKLPAGVARDAAATSLVLSISKSEPETAWTWALNIEAENRRKHAMLVAYQGLQKKDPAIAQQMLQAANLDPAEVQRLQTAPDLTGGGIYRRF